MIKIKQKGDFTRTSKYMEKALNVFNRSILDKYGEDGVRALQEATPKDSGQTAESWFYEIRKDNGTVSLEFHNSYINKGVPIAIILQYGHGTGTGGYVQGIDYINPALQPVFSEIAEKIWKEVRTV